MQRREGINICGGMKEYRGSAVDDDVPKPRTAEELLVLRNRQQELREKKVKTTAGLYESIQADYFR